MDDRLLELPLRLLALARISRRSRPLDGSSAWPADLARDLLPLGDRPVILWRAGPMVLSSRWRAFGPTASALGPSAL
jgi:hypothetical protein